jgi:hypothetical protein
MTGIKTTLDKMFPSSIVGLILSFHYIEAPTNNDAIFTLFDNFIHMFRYAKIFCRVYGFEFSKKVMVMVEDTNFGGSAAFIRHYVHSIDETHYQQNICAKSAGRYPTKYDLEIPIESMICASYSMARTITFSPFQLKIELFCEECHKDLTVAYPEHTIDDRFDNGRIATACIKHR